MRVLFTICAFSVTFSSIICQKIEPIFTSSGLTDGHFWIAKTQQLCFVDTRPHKLCSYHTLTKKVYCARIGNGLVSFAVPVENHADRFVVGSDKDILLVTWDGNTNVENPPTKKLITVDQNIQGNRINYGTADPTGRLWFGTLNNPNGTYGRNLANLYSLDSNLKLQIQIPHVSLSSGFTWSLNVQKLYYDDSLTYQVVAYDYDTKLGTVGNKEVVFDLKQNNITGLAGRLAIDTRGFLWVPLYEGSRVIEIDPKSKKLLRSIQMPARRVGACAFGGTKLDILFVSTIGFGFDNPAEKAPPDDKGGSIFSITGLGVTGLAPISYKLAKV